MTWDYQLNALESNLLHLGYSGSGGKVIRDYKFATTARRLGRADLIAFADSRRHDISTACIAVKQLFDGDKFSVLRQLSYVGAPIAILALSDSVELWPVVHADSTSNQLAPRIIATLQYDEVGKYFDAYKAELSPRSLLDAKRSGRQFSFFSIDPSLEAFARDATQKTLVQQYEEAIGSIPQTLRKKYPTALTRLAIQILAARILQDKLEAYDDLRTFDLNSLLTALRNRFPSYFQNMDKEINLIGKDTAKSLYDRLHSEFTFRSLTNDMLAYFYENTFVTESTREELGIHYTPRFVAERIFQRLPIEDLPPEKRTVLDGTCGSGNLLLAAYNRLSGLLPIASSTEERHSYLLKHIWGVDKDPFAREIARLSLLLYDLPAGDSWDIRVRNVFELNPQKEYGDMPHVIVGNPPFSEPRSTEGERVELAAQVLNRYVDWLAPGGFLGVVVPLTFLNKRATCQSRSKLLASCDLLEVWHMPEGTIPSSSVGTAIILARKLPSRETKSVSVAGLVRVDVVDRNDRTGFAQNQEPTISYVVPQIKWLSAYQQKMESSAFDRVWTKIGMTFPAVHPNFCELNNGVQPGKKARATHFSSTPKGRGWKPVLYKNTNGDILEPFAINSERQRIRYIKYPSEDIQWPREATHFEKSTKLVLNATRNATAPWRFYAAIDRSKLVVTENFHYALPREGVTAQELVAVFNSTLANAWYASHNYQRDVNLSDLKRLPYPVFTSKQKDEIRNLVQQIEKVKSSPTPINNELRKLVTRLDEVVFDAYGISREERKQIQAWMGRFPRPGREWKKIPVASTKAETYSGRRWKLSGEVKSIDAESIQITIWVQGRGESEIPIPSAMPGWALRPGTAFIASVPWEQKNETDLAKIKWFDFSPLEFGYLSEEELVSLLSKNVEE